MQAPRLYTVSLLFLYVPAHPSPHNPLLLLKMAYFFFFIGFCISALPQCKPVSCTMCGPSQLCNACLFGKNLFSFPFLVLHISSSAVQRACQVRSALSLPWGRELVCLRVCSSIFFPPTCFFRGVLGLQGLFKNCPAAERLGLGLFKDDLGGL
jgi:hypothetical protein